MLQKIGWIWKQRQWVHTLLTAIRKLCRLHNSMNYPIGPAMNCIAMLTLPWQFFDVLLLWIFNLENSQHISGSLVFSSLGVSAATSYSKSRSVVSAFDGASLRAVSSRGLYGRIYFIFLPWLLFCPSSLRAELLLQSVLGVLGIDLIIGFLPTGCPLHVCCCPWTNAGWPDALPEVYFFVLLLCIVSERLPYGPAVELLNDSSGIFTYSIFLCSLSVLCV